MDCKSLQNSVERALTRGVDRKLAIDVSRHLIEYASAANDNEGKEEKQTILEKIDSINENDDKIAREIYAQIVKQTRGNEDIDSQRGYWELFVRIVSKIPCPEVRRRFSK